jgi:hypothetical protein
MTKLLRITALAASVAATAIVAMPAAAAPVGAATPATARARIVKPLVLTRVANLDVDTITLGPLPPAAETVAMSQLGVVTCGSGGLTCSGTPVAAEYNVTGTNNQVVQIVAVASSLTNANDATTLSFTPDAPATATLPNSGTTGINFNLGGSITILPATTDGVYTGNIDVTVDYQ